ncbi:MAG: ABZJ_00895 family protein [Gordonia sp. (in: high G+C Gram-positive bacteria)]|uniref:ABZJ_00895 family protein n=1 Tax=Gordonia sp. (in: high G+C Gram-positive bacteria) TaxID=84139 RepID=UPI003BB74FA2
MTETAPTLPNSAGPLWKELGAFALALIGFSLLWGGISSLLDIDSGFISLMIPFVAAAMAIDSYVRTYQRVPSQAEQWWLIWWSFGVAVLYSVLAFLVIAFAIGLGDTFAGIEELGGGILVILATVGIAVEFLVIWASYRFWPKRSLKNRLRWQEKQAAKAAKGR